jgi:helix-turn-helix protein
MNSLGLYLRGLREAKGMSLDDISRSTRVGRRHLEALEGDIPGELPAPVFVKGFIRAYCEFLECPPVDGRAGGRPRPDTSTLVHALETLGSPRHQHRPLRGAGLEPSRAPRGTAILAQELESSARCSRGDAEGHSPGSAEPRQDARSRSGGSRRSSGDGSDIGSDVTHHDDERPSGRSLDPAGIDVRQHLRPVYEFGGHGGQVRQSPPGGSRHRTDLAPRAGG